MINLKAIIKNEFRVKQEVILCVRKKKKESVFPSYVVFYYKSIMHYAMLVGIAIIVTILILSDIRSWTKQRGFKISRFSWDTIR